MTHWHTLSKEKIFERLQSSKEGISPQEAKERLKKIGPNTLPSRSGENIFWIFFRQFHNPLLYLLLASTLLALLLGKYTDGAVIFCVVLLNACIGFVQEYRSHRTIQTLLHMIPQKSNVIREGIPSSIPSSELVLGDILFLQAGDRVAADCRLFLVKNLGCDESALTGESLPVMKREESLPEETTLPERKCMAYNGTLVTSGSSLGIVVATGLATEFGKISQLLESVATLATPLTHTLSSIAKKITWAVFVISLGLWGIGFLRGYSLLEALLASITLAVAAIPEGLPATITIAAAIGVQAMAKRNAIIRHLLAVETLGSTTVICTDKTGTLTQNEMTVQSIWTESSSFFVTGIGYSFEGEIIPQSSSYSPEKLSELLQAIVLCNDSYLVQKEDTLIKNGDPTELALLTLSYKGKIDVEALRADWPRQDVIPFESEKRIMATLNKETILLKGAPEAVIKSCSPELSSLVYEQIEKMARLGMRLIAVAKKELSHAKTSLQEEDIQEGFTFLGLLGMIDPPREEVREAIKACQRAGITVKMITGDHPLTASLIGKEIGIKECEKVALGSDIDNLSEEALQEKIEQCNLFARALPEHKLKILQALQAKGQVVAMTGDGVNDAPALKGANIGIAMGISGTAVAKEASDMLLADDHFATIEAAVEEGRRVYDNLVKAIAFMFPTNLAQALVILFAVLFFPIYNKVLLLPILPVQILWINLVVSVALSLPLAFEIMEPDIMKRPPRSPNAPLLNSFIIIRTLIVALIMSAGTIGLFLWEYREGLAEGAASKVALAEAQTMAVTTLVFFQVFYLFNCRSLRFSLFTLGFFSNLYILLGVGFVILVQLGFVYLPFMHTLFNSTFLDLKSWLLSIGVALTILPLIALEKSLLKRFFSN